ncbi:MAG: anthranilate synthase component I [bacterium]
MIQTKTVSGGFFDLEAGRGRRDGIIKTFSGDRFTPFTLAKKLDAKVILESASFKKGRERYSLLLVREAFTILQEGSDLVMSRAGKRHKLKTAAKDILDLLGYFARQHPPLQQDIPLPAGGIGFLSYEFARFCDNIKFTLKEDALGLPTAAFIFGHIFIIFDHYTDIIYLMGLNYKEHEIDLPAAIAATEDRLNDLNFNYLSAEERSYPGTLLSESGEKEEYMQGVQQVKNEIVKGNLLQGVLSRRVYLRTEMPPLQAYKQLRSHNPSPYLFYIDFGQYQLFGSSPEVHVKVKNGRAEIHPIAGTRRRGKTVEEDQRLEKELLNDEKERAEHLMLIDLARNDLGRICRPGTIKVDQYMQVEHFSHVMHIVSKISGEIDPNMSGADAIRATFPAGTVSGAPKIRAVETIDRIEAEPRGFYSGIVGYMEPDGGVDTCITIRSALKQGDTLVLQAGAGVVYDSLPEREYEETNEKLRALAAAVGMEL